MNEWLIWGIIVVVGFGGFALIRYLLAKKKKDNYDREVGKINKDIDEKVSHAEEEGMKKAAAIRAQAIEDAKKDK